MTTNAFRKRWPFLGASCNDAHNDCGFIAFKIIKLFISAVIIGGFLLFLFVGIGKISSYLGEKNVPELVSVGDRDTSVDSTGFSSIDQPKELALSVGLFADSEGDSANLKKAINRMEDLSVDIAFFLGDLTRWGSLEELKERIGKGMWKKFNTLHVYDISKRHPDYINNNKNNDVENWLLILENVIKS